MVMMVLLLWHTTTTAIRKGIVMAWDRLCTVRRNLNENRQHKRLRRIVWWVSAAENGKKIAWADFQSDKSYRIGFCSEGAQKFSVNDEKKSQIVKIMGTNNIGGHFFRFWPPFCDAAGRTRGKGNGVYCFFFFFIKWA